MVALLAIGQACGLRPSVGVGRPVGASLKTARVACSVINHDTMLSWRALLTGQGHRLLTSRHVFQSQATNQHALNSVSESLQRA